MKKNIVGSFIIAALFIPVLTSADVITDLQAQIQRLLAQIAALQAQQTVSTALPSTGTTDDYPTAPTSTTCPNLSVTMQRGSRDATTRGQVTELQIFLADHFGLNEDDIVTGYFGPTTHRYVVKFQTANNLPAYGIVGSMTRAAIARVCSVSVSETGDTNTWPGCPDSPSYISKCSNGVSWKPDNERQCTYWYCADPSVRVPNETGKQIKCGVNTFKVQNTCGADVYPPVHSSAYVQCYDGYAQTLGDATSCKSSATWKQYADDICAKRCSTDTIATSTPTISCPIYARSEQILRCKDGEKIVNDGVDARGCQLPPRCVPLPTSGTLSAFPSQGTAPLTVVFSGNVSSAGYTLEYGDGTSTSFGCAHGGCPAGNQSTTVDHVHTYTAAGTYTAKLRQHFAINAGNCAGADCNVVSRVTVTVTSNQVACTPLAPQTQTISCPAGQTGSITQQRVSSCSSGATNPVWSEWMTTVNTCSVVQTPATTSITAYPNFTNLCYAFVTDYVNGNNVLGQYANTCTETAKNSPLLYSVTHEVNGGHIGATNYSPTRGVYMNDYDYATDYNQWMRSNFYPSADGTIFGMALDTLNFSKTNVTGWPLQTGNLFFGLNDISTAHANVTLDKDIVIEFDMRIRGDNIGSSETLAGHRIMLGSLLDWPEQQSRTNRAHFFEVNLTYTPGYSAIYHDPDLSLCHDTAYDRCAYDPYGTWSENRYVSYAKVTGSSPNFVMDQWVHVRIPLSYAKSLGWVSKPSSWSDAKLAGIYLGIESTGATRYWLEVKNYQVYF